MTKSMNGTTNKKYIQELERIKKEIALKEEYINDSSLLNEYINALLMASQYMVSSSPLDYQRYHGQLSDLIELFRAKIELKLL
jgi:hypothetical protein